MKTRFTPELEAAAEALYTRQAHQMKMRAAWFALPHTIKEEYCLWAADVLRATMKRADPDDLWKVWNTEIERITADSNSEAKPS